MAKKVLLVGESWMSFTTHVKGFDTFYTSVYETGHQFLQAAMEKGGYDFKFMPNISCKSKLLNGSSFTKSSTLMSPLFLT